MMRVLLSALVLLLSGCGVNMAVPHTAGSGVLLPHGDQFTPHRLFNLDDAIVYIYRPTSRWGDDELQAPGIFIGNDQLFGLKSGTYGWVELPPGSYDFYAKRPLGPLFLTTIFDLKLKVKEGKRYFFRYSELHPLNLVQVTAHPKGYLADGPLQQVPASIGVWQIRYLKQASKGRVLKNH